MLLKTDLSDIGALRSALHDEGDSLIVTQGVGKMRIHLHTNDPERLLSLLRGFGAVLNQKVDDMFRHLAAHYRAIVALPVSAAISGTWNAMRLEAESLRNEGDPIQVVDTRLNSVAQGLVVLETARAAAAGAGFDELVRIAERARERTKIYVGVNTFKYMVRGGRVSRLKGLVATALNLKPVITLDEAGKGAAFSKAFSQKGVIRKILDIVSRTKAEAGIERYAVVHAAAPDRAEEFAERLEGIVGKPPEYIMEISPIVGSHAGKGALAVAVETR